MKKFVEEVVVSPFLGTVKYQSDAVPTGLVSTGQVYLVRDTTGSDTPPVGTQMQDYEVPIINGRECDRHELHTHGFELVRHIYPHIDYFDEQQIVFTYYREVEEFVKRNLGADKVVAYDHNVRTTRTKSWIQEEETTPQQVIKGGNLIQGPASIIHNDFSYASAARRLKQLVEPPKANDTWEKLTNGEPLLTPEEYTLATTGNGRYVFLNLWRNIVDEPIEDNHLTMCDARTIHPKDIITFEIRYVDRIGENYLARYSPNHRWVYFPRMSKEEALLLKVWDSQGIYAHLETVETEAEIQLAQSTREEREAKQVKPATFSLHTAFTDPTASPNVPKRVSMEVRVVALFYNTIKTL
eukprot:TRINITY_DN10147_c0_g1_i2.p1 TRINITY_DN10147_c0_g1~~TRINITY_DN10147_c0_g1_i2.p1  ORF type:complete len:354 (-),score=59.72 TRINITY_DN10147_c0_g1_i2:22-1083(-)